MQFNEIEVRFLIGEHYVPGGQREVLRPIVDIRKMGCPENVFFRVLEHRALKLGKSLAEFRALMTAAPGLAPPQDDLATQLQGLKLF